MTPIPITDIDDPRIAAFRNIRERDLTGRDGLFIAEGDVVVRVMLSPASRCTPLCLLIEQRRAPAFLEAAHRFATPVPVYAADQSVLNAIAGFDLHRGILGLGRKPVAERLSDVLPDMADDAVILAASGIGNHDNIGSLFRNAAAFGAHAVLLDEQCADPFYRKAIRVSSAAVLRQRQAAPTSLDEMVSNLQSARVQVLALTPGAKLNLKDVQPGGRRCILLGSEGPGLPQQIIDRCTGVSIPMSGGFDSLNVAVTSGIALHHFTTPPRSG